MRRQTRTLWAGAVIAGAALVGLANDRALAQTRRAIVPERQLLGVRLGRPFLEVFKKYGQPTEVQTVALSATPETLPSLGGGAGGAGMGDAGGMGIPGMGGPGMGGGSMGMMGSMMGGGRPGMGGMPSPFGGAMGAPRPGGMGGMGIPSAAPGGMGGAYPGMGGPGMMGGGSMGMMGAPGMGGSMGMMGAPGMGGGMMGGAGAGGAAGNQPEYSSAFLLVYRKPASEARMEFLVNEDGRVAQISVAAPAAKTAIANKTISGAVTSKRVRLGTPYQQVLSTYGTPERHRLLPGFRFMEAYFSKNYHSAFTFDTQQGLKCVRITIALAD